MNTLISTGRRNPKDLKPHPLNDEIYGDRTDADLIESIRSKGVLNPLLITNDGFIISGHRRWGASLAVGLDLVPVVVFGSSDNLDIEEAIIESNRQRIKTNEQLGREYAHLSRILNDRQSRQGTNQHTKSEVNRSIIDSQNPPVKTAEQIGASVRIRTEAKPPSVQAAEVLGISKDTANKAATVVKAIDTYASTGDKQAADHLRAKLNVSVDGAYKEAKATGAIAPKQEPPKPKETSAITVDVWNKATGAQHAEWMFAQHSGKSQFNQTNDNVEWASWTWNPITGCLHDCAYCYARDIANRFFSHLPDGERFAPVFYPDRLSAATNTKLPDLSGVTNPVKRMGLQNVFTCSMADMFGKWVPSAWIEAVLQQVWDNPQWNFLFLTKFPIRMAEFEYPPNTWIGTTVDTQYAVERAEKAFRKVRASGYKGVAWLSCEPMMERLTFSGLDMFDWVVVGGASRSTRTPEFRPPFEWIVHLWNQAKALDLPFYMKTNLFLDDANKGIDIPNRVREYPLSKISA